MIEGGAAGEGGFRYCMVTTRSPAWRSLTSGPTASTTPEGSTPSTCGSFTGIAYLPERTTRSSVRFTDTARTRISTSPGPGTGVGTSSRRITSGAPNSRMTIAFTLAHGVRDERLRRRRAPLRAQALFRREEIGRRARVQDIRVGPVLVHAAPRILPVIVDLAAEQ